MKEKILVSACLLGVSCRYDGQSKENKDVLDYIKDKEIIIVCPEIMGGLATPRVASERKLDKVINKDGVDVTLQYRKGAEETLRLAKMFGIKKALLKAKSPSCGSNKIYDGTFSGILIDGNGVTAELLKQNGIEVITEEDIKK